MKGRIRYGKSGWRLKSLFAFHMDNFVGISRRPFQFLSLICIGVAVVFLIRIMLAWTVPFTILQDITHGLILNVIMFHLLVVVGVMAIIGEYVIRNFIALQAYPIYIVRQLFRKSAEK